MHEVVIERRAARDIKALPPEIFHRIIPHLKSLAVNPNPPGCRKITGSKSDWRIRVGAYRILYEIDAKTKTIKIMRIRHRREAYRYFTLMALSTFFLPIFYESRATIHVPRATRHAPPPDCRAP